MRIDPRTVETTLAVMALVFMVLTIAVWWTRRTYPGFGRWAVAGPLLVLSLFLMSLRPTGPDWVSIVAANAIIAFVSILYFEGARQFRGLPPGRWVLNAGGGAAVGGVAFFLYVVPSLNARAAVMSAFLGIVFLCVSVTLLRGVPLTHRLGLRLTGSLFALCAATNMARAVYSAFGPPMKDLFMMSGVNGAFFLIVSAELSFFSIGFILLADERVISDLQDAHEQVQRADAEIAQRREAEVVLRESERRFRTLADATPVLIWMAGPDKRRTYVNRPWLDFTGRSIDAELEDGWAESVHPDDLIPYLETYAQAFDRNHPLTREYRLRRHDGEYRWVLDTGVPRFTREGAFEGYIGSAVDVTDQKVAKTALASLSHRLMQAQEQERAWIARELHDDLAQRTVGLGIQLHTVAQALSSDAAGQARIVELGNEATNLSRDIQNLTHRLHSSKLEYFGLTSAAASLCKEMSRQQGAQIAFRADGILDEPPKEIALALFRVLQEALTNTVKHSRAQSINVILRGRLDAIQMEVLDTGIGFDPATAVRGTGLGLISMQERLSLVGGQLSIESRPGLGTTVRARVPLGRGSE